MGTKNFSGGLNALLEPSVDKEKKETPVKKSEKTEPVQKKGRPRTNVKEVQKTSQEGTLPGETRATFIVNENMLEQLKAVAFWDRTSIKDVVHSAIGVYLSEKGDKYLNNALSEFRKKKKL